LKPLVFVHEGPDLMGPANLDVATTHEIVGVDLIVLEEALDTLSRARAGGRFGVHADIHISSLSTSAGRQALLSRLSAAGREAARRLVVELVGLGLGVPPAVLDAAVASLTPFTLGVVARAPSLATDMRAWRSAHLAAVSYDLADLPPADGVAMGEAMGRFAAQAAPVARGVIAHSATTRAQALAAWAAGFTDISGDVLSESGAGSFMPMRFAPEDLYRGVKGRQAQRSPPPAGP
jgi:hypothetical protein